MPRINSQNWAATDQIQATRLQHINQDIDDLYAYGSDRLRVRTAVSGQALKIDVGAGAALVGTSFVVYAGGLNISVTDNATNYVMLNGGGVITISTSGYDAANARLATVTAAGGVITNITITKPDAFGGNLAGAHAETLYWGDKSDGNVTLSGNVTVQRDMYYDTLDLAGFQLLMNGYKIFARHITDSVGGGALVAPAGGNASNGTNAIAASGSCSSSNAGTPGNGGSGGLGGQGKTLPHAPNGVGGGGGGQGGWIGGDGTASVGAGANVTNSLGTTQGASSNNGGKGGDGDSMAGGLALGNVGGTATFHGAASITEYQTFGKNLTFGTLTAFTGVGRSAPAPGGGGGGKGASGNSRAGPGGGGGGQGGTGGFWFVAAQYMSGNWNIRSYGGNGGNGGNGSSGVCDNWGGGGGGCGGNTGDGGSGINMFQDKSGWTGIYDLAPGTTVGTGGLGFVGGYQSGSNGQNGNIGKNGIAFQYQL